MANNIDENELLNAILYNDINDDLLETNIQNNNKNQLKQSTGKILKEGTYRIAMATNPSIGLDIDSASKDNNANV